MFWPVRILAVVLTSLGLSGCAHTNITPGFLEKVPALDPQDFTCCAEPERFYPAGLIRAAFALAEKFGPSAARTIYGGYEEKGYPGRLAGNAAAEAAIGLAILVVLFRNRRSIAVQELNTLKG